MRRRAAIGTLALLLLLGACSSDDDDGAPAADGADATTEAGPATDAAADGSDAAPRDASDASAPRCSSEGFCRADLDHGDNVVGVWGDGSGVVWATAVGPGGGKIYRWDGAAWSIDATFSDQTPTGIWGSGPTDIYVSTSHAKFDPLTGISTQPGEVLHGTGPSSNALTWTATQVSRAGVGFVVMGNVWGTGPGDVWLAGTEDPLGVSRGFVAHLTKRADGTPTSAVDYLAPVAVAPNNPKTLSVVFGTGASDVWAGGAETVVGDDGSILQAVGIVLHRSVNGTTVTWKTDTGANTVIGKGFVNTLAGAGIAPGKVAVSIVNGKGCEAVVFQDTPAWTKLSVAPPICHQPRALWGTTNDLWAIGEGGLVREWNGTTWRLARTVTDDAPIAWTLNGIWASGPEDLWVVGDHGTVLHKTKAGMP